MDELLVRDREYWRYTRPVVRAQLRLQEAVSEDAYDRYMVVEDLVNDRVNFILEKVVRWAFEQGRKAGR